MEGEKYSERSDVDEFGLDNEDWVKFGECWLFSGVLRFYCFFKLGVWLLLAQLARDAGKLWCPCRKVASNFGSEVTHGFSEAVTFIRGP